MASICAVFVTHFPGKQSQLVSKAMFSGLCDRMQDDQEGPDPCGSFAWQPPLSLLVTSHDFLHESVASVSTAKLVKHVEFILTWCRSSIIRECSGYLLCSVPQHVSSVSCGPGLQGDTLAPPMDRERRRRTNVFMEDVDHSPQSADAMPVRHFLTPELAARSALFGGRT